MTKVEPFEGVFRAAVKPVYEYHPLAIDKALIASDLEGEDRDAFEAQVIRFGGVLSDTGWTSVGREGFGSSAEVLELIDRESFDLVVTYRHLHSPHRPWPHSLGAYVDLLSQAAPCPLLVLPHPESGHAMPSIHSVMALTDCLSGDARLVNYAVRFASSGGSLHLAHVEDRRAFDRFVDVITRVPAFDNATATEAIRDRVLAEAEDYVKSCRAVLQNDGVDVHVDGTVTMGQRFDDYACLIDEHRVDLLVMNTVDEDRPAMHGMVRALAVELREIPLLLL